MVYDFIIRCKSSDCFTIKINDIFETGDITTAVNLAADYVEAVHNQQPMDALYIEGDRTLEELEHFDLLHTNKVPPWFKFAY